jgi:hypothetical protein
MGHPLASPSPNWPTINPRCIDGAVRSADRCRMEPSATIASAIVVGAIASGRIAAVIDCSAGGSPMVSGPP